jgi:hypothetical protein
VASARNKDLRSQIAAENKKLFGKSDMDVERIPILENIKALSLQLEQEPHWTTVPTFWLVIVGTVAGCIAAYYGYLGYRAQSQQAVVPAPATVPQAQHSGDKKPNSPTQSAPTSQQSQGSK